MIKIIDSTMWNIRITLTGFTRRAASWHSGRNLFLVRETGYLRRIAHFNIATVSSHVGFYMLHIDQVRIMNPEETLFLKKLMIIVQTF